ncbi:MAG: hypothetical protein DMF68_07730 [Acidobacteria bacterium]|nr:MAG: hypothetical protein DMF68_07730 [Acidobacteriota bacterium]
MKSKDKSFNDKQTSRRQFAKSVASTLLAAPLAASLAKGQTPTKKEPVAPPNPLPTQTPQKPSALAEAYTEVARLRFEHLTPEQLEQVKRRIDGYVRKDGTTDRLRAVKLKNSDEPDFTFSAG